MPKQKQKTTTEATTEKPLYQRVEKDKLPVSMKQKGTGIYGKLVNGIAKEKIGYYRVTVANLGVKSTKLKSIYPSLEKELQRLAKRCMTKEEWDITETKPIKTEKGEDKTIVTHPKYSEWKGKNLRIRVINSELYLEKLTDKPLP